MSDSGVIRGWTVRRLLGAADWLRERNWLRSLYRMAPLALRQRVSFALSDQSATQARETYSFKRLAPANVVREQVIRRGIEYGDDEGVNIFGYLRGQFGLGESARMYAQALLGAGYPVALVDVDINLPHGMEDATFEARIGDDAPYGSCLIFVNPDYLAQAVERIGEAKLAGKYIIACWFWELENVPEPWLDAIPMVDEIMVSSRYVRDAFVRATDKPVFLVNLPLGHQADSGLSRTDFGLPRDKYIFLNSFDFNSWVARKNPLAVIDAFRRAFPVGRDDILLLLKTSNGYRNPQKLKELTDYAEGDPRIMVRDDVLDRAHIQALQRCADAYVSLHRAEGFGLGMAESMALGKPVIGTGWSGNVDFMAEDNSCLVGYRLVPVEAGQYAHHEGQRWAEADRDQAAAYMRRLVADREYGHALGRAAAESIRTTLSPEVAAAVIISRLRALKNREEDRGR